jgi:hypothetical protein
VGLQLGIHEYFPECEKLTQEYDQLRAGVWPLTKTAEQRTPDQELAHQAGDRDPDGRDPEAAPQPVVPVVPDHHGLHGGPPQRRLLEGRIEALAPAQKEGRKVVLQLSSEDSEGFAHYAELLPKVKLARATLEKFEETVTEVLRRMSESG